MKYYLVYVSHDGQTEKITKRIQQVLLKHEHEVVLTQLSTGKEPLPQDLGHSRIILAVPIRYGYHLPAMRNYVKRNLQALNQAQTAFISINLTARKPEKNTAETNLYCRKFLQKSGLLPKHAAVFAGALQYPRYRFFDRIMIQLIMKMTGGPTDPTVSMEFTDWDKVNAFGQKLSSWT